MSFEIKKASRQGVKPLISFYSESGCGKTYSSLLFARGFVGPKGHIVMVDTEGGRGSLYADVLPGGYDVLELREPFGPERYIEAIQAVEQSGAAIGIIDSGSHEWEGIGGVLDMAAKREEKSGKGLHCWNAPKMEHAKFLNRLLQSTIPWIVCLRAKYKTRQVKNNGKTEIIKDDQVTPIQSEDFIFEATCHGYILQDHKFILTKCSHPALRKCLPNNEPVTAEHGFMVAEWCASPGGGTTKNGDKNALLSELRSITTHIHGWQKGMSASEWNLLKPKLEQELWDNAILLDTESLADLSVERLREVIKAVQEKLQPAGVTP